MTTSRKRNKTFSQTEIKRILSQAVFNPRTPGPMSVVADCNCTYYEQAISVAAKESCMLFGRDYEEKMLHIIRLATLCIAKSRTSEVLLDEGKDDQG